MDKTGNSQETLNYWCHYSRILTSSCGRRLGFPDEYTHWKRLQPDGRPKVLVRSLDQSSETDPLICPRCGGAMRILALIDQPEVIEEILTHLGLWPYPAHAPPSIAVA